VIHQRGPWRHLDAVEYATLEWVDGFNHRRLLEPIGHIPPAELEAAYDRHDENHYPSGIKVTDEQLAKLSITRDEFHGEWNYKIAPHPLNGTDSPA
jgi:hypothetical protein